MSNKGRLMAIVCSSILLACTAARASEAPPKTVLDDGQQVFAENCAHCHGDKGKGDGPMASVLSVKPTDLTQLAKRNGGKFDFWKEFNTIDGRDILRAHGASQMPIWGSKFSNEWGRAGMRARLIEVTFYIQSIQEK